MPRIVPKAKVKTIIKSNLENTWWTRFKNNEINLFLDYQLFSSCLFDDINGPVELLSLETPIVDFFPWRASTMGATNSSSSFETILYSLVTQKSIAGSASAAPWFISVLQKWDAVHNNIQGRRKIGKLSLMLLHCSLLKWILR